MPLQLYFVPSKLPRAWTRKQWKEAYRWVRVTRKELNKRMEKQIELINQIQTDIMFYGTAAYTMKDGLIESVINPGLLLGPGME